MEIPQVNPVCNLAHCCERVNAVQIAPTDRSGFPSSRYLLDFILHIRKSS